MKGNKKAEVVTARVVLVPAMSGGNSLMRQKWNQEATLQAKLKFGEVMNRTTSSVQVLNQSLYSTQQRIGETN